jgi:hypothetical protein
MADQLAAREVFSACFKQGYYHGQGKKVQGVAMERGVFLGM